MRPRSLIFMLFLSVVFSCKKGREFNGLPSPFPIPVPSVLLKEINIPNLPSPYYHLEYDSTKRVSFISFASELTRYNVVYKQGKIIELRNNILVNKDRLQYVYDNNGDVIAVKYADSTGLVYKRIIFSYDAHKLIQSERQTADGPGFLIEKTMKFSYYPDGNLKDIVYHYLPVHNQTDETFADHFDQYDNNINVDGFGLLHNDFFDHLILLPAVQLQKNNPLKETRTGDGINYTVDYTYNYDQKKAPLSKSGDLVITNGTDAGRHFQIGSAYSYY